MRKHALLKMACVVFMFCIATAIALPAQTFTTLASFDMTDGWRPFFAPLVQSPNGRLYGTTGGGGTGLNYGGTVFEIAPTGQLHTLYSFCVQTNCADGESPYAGLIVASNGNFYGTTGSGGISTYCPNPTGFGCGTIFEITPAGKLTTLYNFCSQANCADGSSPEAGLVQATDGNFYGTTNGGGVNGPNGLSGGTVFVISPTGKLKTLYSFCSQVNSGACLDGQSPNARLIQATNGNFYGTTVGGGSTSAGTVFEITPGGKLKTLHTFCSQHNSQGYCSDGESPYAGLVQAANGNFYGTTANGGNNGYGAVFEMTPTGKLTTLYSFCSQANCADGDWPEAPLMQGTDGNFYGTTYLGGASATCTFSGMVIGCGTVFKITPSGQFTTLHSFCVESSCADGQYPYGGLMQATNGRFYGTTSAGANLNCDQGNGCGSVFSLSIGAGGSLKSNISFQMTP